MRILAKYMNVIIIIHVLSAEARNLANLTLAEEGNIKSIYCKKNIFLFQSYFVNYRLIYLIVSYTQDHRALSVYTHYNDFVPFRCEDLGV